MTTVYCLAGKYYRADTLLMEFTSRAEAFAYVIPPKPKSRKKTTKKWK